MESNSSRGLSVPPEWDRFCGEVRDTARANQTRIDAFFELQGMFQKKALEAMPVKGLDLLLRAYPTPGQRPMVDCDLLIHKKDIPVIMRLFEEKGFKRKPDEGLTYISHERGLNFDLLWDFWYQPSMEGVWKRSLPYLYEGRPFKALHPEDALLYMVTYVTAHRGVLSPLLGQDMQFFLEAQGNRIQWKKLIDQAAGRQMKIPFRHGLLYAAQNGCDQIPEEAFAGLSPSSTKEKRLAALYEKIVTEDGHPPISYFFTWLGYPTFEGKLKFLREKFFPSKLEAEIHWGPLSLAGYWARVLFRPFYLIFRSLLIFSRDLIFFLPRLRK